MAPPAPARVMAIEPSLVQPDLRRWLDPHMVAFDGHVEPRNKLLLFLCGSFGTPARQQLFIQTAAAQGYHAINLSYPNSWTVGGLCRGSANPTCHGTLRRDIIYGRSRSGQMSLAAGESVVERFAHLLDYLAKHQSDRDWSRYINSGSIDWSSVITAGHSQGGGHAAVIAKDLELHRVIMLAAPVDHHQASGEPASWLSDPAATPPSRWLGFIHRRDQGLAHVRRAWSLLGLDAFGPPVNVDNSTPPYAGSHQLFTEIGGVHGNRFHGSVVQDRVTPLATTGTPIFLPTWRYLLDADDTWGAASPTR